MSKLRLNSEDDDDLFPPSLIESIRGREMHIYNYKESLLSDHTLYYNPVLPMWNVGKYLHFIEMQKREQSFRSSNDKEKFDEMFLNLINFSRSPVDRQQSPQVIIDALTLYFDIERHLFISGNTCMPYNRNTLNNEDFYSKMLSNKQAVAFLINHSIMVETISTKTANQQRKSVIQPLSYHSDEYHFVSLIEKLQTTKYDADVMNEEKNPFSNVPTVFLDVEIGTCSPLFLRKLRNISFLWKNYSSSISSNSSSKESQKNKDDDNNPFDWNDILFISSNEENVTFQTKHLGRTVINAYASNVQETIEVLMIDKHEGLGALIFLNTHKIPLQIINKILTIYHKTRDSIHSKILEREKSVSHQNSVTATTKKQDDDSSDLSDSDKSNKSEEEEGDDQDHQKSIVTKKYSSFKFICFCGDGSDFTNRNYAHQTFIIFDRLYNYFSESLKNQPLNTRKHRHIFCERWTYDIMMYGVSEDSFLAKTVSNYKIMKTRQESMMNKINLVQKKKVIAIFKELEKEYKNDVATNNNTNKKNTKSHIQVNALGKNNNQSRQQQTKTFVILCSNVIAKNELMKMYFEDKKRFKLSDFFTKNWVYIRSENTRGQIQDAWALEDDETQTQVGATQTMDFRRTQHIIQVNDHNYASEKTDVQHSTFETVTNYVGPPVHTVVFIVTDQTSEKDLVIASKYATGLFEVYYSYGNSYKGIISKSFSQPKIPLFSNLPNKIFD